MQGKESEGDQHMKAAAQFTTKTWLRWSEDWESASGEYERAATCYKNARQTDKCIEAYIGAAEAQYKCTLLHSAGKNYELAGDVAVSGKQAGKRAVELYQKAAELFHANGLPERAADSLQKAAKALEKDASCLKQALELYQEAAGFYEDDGKLSKTQEAYKKSSCVSTYTSAIRTGY
eukprot:TRINITY_DN2136_c1_g1_i2.p1 TRINITY_DN2136_c1_g1~~TRINITY_DN2136_c1_g1_i2.p1  ORF type:complete len:177 (+),score=34.32 TRINITY_DN2136_c1_g1_i2:217-747(+)